MTRASTGLGLCPATHPVGLSCALEEMHPELHWDSFEWVAWSFWSADEERADNPERNYHHLGRRSGQ